MGTFPKVPPLHLEISFSTKRGGTLGNVPIFFWLIKSTTGDIIKNNELL